MTTHDETVLAPHLGTAHLAESLTAAIEPACPGELQWVYLGDGTMTPPAPQRAQRVRGIPGVGLRAPDGREWVRDGHSTYAVVSGMRHETCTVRFCGRPSRWGNPWGAETCRCDSGHPVPHWHVRSAAGRVIGAWHDKRSAMAHAVTCFRSFVYSYPDTYFTDLLGFDFLSCFCPLNSPCHVDAIIAEGVARGIWTA